MASGGSSETISYSRSGVGSRVGPTVGDGVLVAIGFAVFLSGLAVAVSARGGGDTVVAVGAARYVPVGEQTVGD